MIDDTLAGLLREAREELASAGYSVNDSRGIVSRIDARLKCHAEDEAAAVGRLRGLIKANILPYEDRSAEGRACALVVEHAEEVQPKATVYHVPKWCVNACRDALELLPAPATEPEAAVVERVARAIMAYCIKGGWAAVEDMDGHIPKAYLGEARAALAALSETTPASATAASDEEAPASASCTGAAMTDRDREAFEKAADEEWCLTAEEREQTFAIDVHDEYIESDVAAAWWAWQASAARARQEERERCIGICSAYMDAARKMMRRWPGDADLWAHKGHAANCIADSIEGDIRARRDEEAATR